MTDTPANTELDELRKEGSRIFFMTGIPPSRPAILSLTDNLRPPFAEVGRAFVQNLDALVHTASLPFTLARANARNRHMQRFVAGQRIRAFMDVEHEDGDSEEVMKKREHDFVLRTSREKMDEFQTSPDGKQTLLMDSIRFLLGGYRNGDLAMPAAELLRQAVVLAWGAFEVLCRDIFVAHLNETPLETKRLTEDATAKKRFDGTKIPLDLLSNNGFDLSARMGAVLVAQQDFSDLPTIKAVLLALFGESDELRQAMDSKDLWLLSQRRHLIVHRRGFVDRQYLDKTGDTIEVGTHLAITPDGLDTHLGTVITVGGALLSSRTGWRKPSG